jgi:hypothetical protein
MTQDVHAWGVRLGDKVRAALARGDIASARHLALHGDGQARNLAREYAFMVRGLGLTLRLLLRLLVQAATRGGTPVGATDGLAAVVLRLLRGLRDGAGEPQPLPEAGADPAQLADACVQGLDASEERFALDQDRLAEEVVRMLGAGDAPAATALLDAKDRAYLALHDPMVRFMADGFAWVLGHFGARALLEFHLVTAEGQRAGFEKWESLSAGEFAATTAFLLRQHMGQVLVEEDDRRFTIRQSPCGSGGRLNLGGAYAGPQPLPLVEEPGPLTFGEPRMPVYCTHCAVWNGTATLSWFGRAQWVFEQPARADGGCTLHIYKRREDAPADYTRRVALPAAGAP